MYSYNYLYGFILLYLYMHISMCAHFTRETVKLKLPESRVCAGTATYIQNRDVHCCGGNWGIQCKCFWFSEGAIIPTSITAPTGRILEQSSNDYALELPWKSG